MYLAGVLPNIESQHEAFLEEVEVALGKATSSESLVLLGDFNAHVGIDNATWKGVIGQHGDPDINKNGRCLLQFCATNGLCIMNTFFQHKRIRKYTWYRDSVGQRSVIDFCIVSADLFSTVSDVRVKKGAELSTDDHLVVFTLKALKPLKKRKTFQPRETYRIKWESLADKEVRTAFADNMASKFKELPPSTEDIETEWCLFRTAVITSATGINCCGRKRVGGRRVARKELLGGTNKLKKLFVRKKWPIRPGLPISRHLNFVRSTLNKVAPTKVKLSKERAWKEFGERLDDDFKTASKVFWQTIRRLRRKRSRAALFIEDANGVTLKDQDTILNRWRDYFSDLLNPVDATPIQIHEEQVGEDIQITEADVNAIIKSLKTGKAPGEDDIRPEMLKAMNIVFVG